MFGERSPSALPLLLQVLAFSLSPNAHRRESWSRRYFSPRRQFVRPSDHESGRSDFADVGDVSGLKRAHLLPLQGYQRHRVAVLPYELHLERRAIRMYQDRSAHIPALQTVRGKIACQCDRVQLFDRARNLGSGCAVTKRGVSLPLSIYQAHRTFKTLPPGALIGPSTT
jgi:hypothetical protein